MYHTITIFDVTVLLSDEFVREKKIAVQYLNPPEVL